MRKINTSLIGLTLLLSSTVATASEQLPKLLEVVTFSQADGVSDKDVARAMNEFTPFMNKYGTLVLRTVSQAEDGSWKMMNLNRNRPD